MVSRGPAPRNIIEAVYQACLGTLWEVAGFFYLYLTRRSGAAPARAKSMVGKGLRKMRWGSTFDFFTVLQLFLPSEQKNIVL